MKRFNQALDTATASIAHHALAGLRADLITSASTGGAGLLAFLHTIDAVVLEPTSSQYDVP